MLVDGDGGLEERLVPGLEFEDDVRFVMTGFFSFPLKFTCELGNLPTTPSQ